MSVNDVSRMGPAHGSGGTAAALHIKADKTANRISVVWCDVVGWRGWGAEARSLHEEKGWTTEELAAACITF